MKRPLPTSKHLLAPVAWLLAGLLLVLPMGQHGAGLVLCIGAGGHLDIEGAHGSDCAPPHDDAAHTRTLPHAHGSGSPDGREAGADGCTSPYSPCVDVVVEAVGGEHALAKPAPTAPDVPSIAVVAAVFVPTSAPASLPRAPALRERPSSSLTALRTVVLLI